MKIKKILIFALVFSIFCSSIQLIGEAANDEFDSDDNIKFLMNDLYMPSLSVGIIDKDELVWHDGYGSYRGYHNSLIPKEEKIPTKDTVYMAGSISKTVTATALMQLYEKGLFNLDDKVGDHLGYDLKSPYFPNDDITIKMLLNHTSTLNDSLNMLIFSGARFFIKNYYALIGFYLTSNLKFLNKIFWLDEHKPGTYFSYANSGYAVLEILIEILSGKSYDDYCKENIFDPLEMYNTSFNHHDYEKDQLAVPYIWYDKINMYFRLPQYNVPFKGAGSLRSSVEDLAHLLIAHMNNGMYKNVKILNDSTVSLMHNFSSQVRGDGEDYYSGYGMGWMIYNNSNVTGHDGDTFGGHAKMKWNQTNDIGLIYFWNGSNFIHGLDKTMNLIAGLECELLKKYK